MNLVWVHVAHVVHGTTCMGPFETSAVQPVREPPSALPSIAGSFALPGGALRKGRTTACLTISLGRSSGPMPTWGRHK